MIAANFSNTFIPEIKTEEVLFQLIEYVPGLYVFVKDVHGKYVKWSRSVMRVFGIVEEEEYLRKTDFDFFPKNMALQYQQSDREILSGDKAFNHRVELILQKNGMLTWVSTKKIPIFSHGDKVVGVLGMSRSFFETKNHLNAYRELKPVLDVLFQHYSQKVNMTEVAKLLEITSRQLGYKFRHHLHMSMHEFLLKIRSVEAGKLLLQTSMSIQEIATRSGFYDRSSFSKQFYKVVGLLPKEYRRIYQKL